MSLTLRPRLGAAAILAAMILLLAPILGCEVPTTTPADDDDTTGDDDATGDDDSSTTPDFGVFMAEVPPGVPAGMFTLDGVVADDKGASTSCQIAAPIGSHEVGFETEGYYLTPRDATLPPNGDSVSVTWEDSYWAAMPSGEYEDSNGVPFEITTWLDNGQIELSIENVLEGGLVTGAAYAASDDGFDFSGTISSDLSVVTLRRAYGIEVFEETYTLR